MIAPVRKAEHIRFRSNRLAPSVAGLTALLLAATAVTAASNDPHDAEAYISPPERIAEAVTAPWHENVTLSNLSPDGRWFLDAVGDGLPRLERLSRQYTVLGEANFDVEANRDRNLTIRGSIGYDIRDADTLEVRRIDAPDGARVSNASWSPDGSRLAFFAHYKDATFLYLANPQTGETRRITDRPINATLTRSFDWTGDGAHILTVLIPNDRGKMPNRAVPTEPHVRVAREGTTPTRVYRFLLKSPHDADLYRYFTTGQLALVNVQNGTVRNIGEPAMFRSINVSPDGQHARVSTVLEPLVYHLPATRFGFVEELWDLDGNVIYEFNRRELEPSEDDPEDDEEDDRPEKRSISWRPDGQGMSFLQLEPEDDENENERRGNDDDDNADADANRTTGNQPDARDQRQRRGDGAPRGVRPDTRDEMIDGFHVSSPIDAALLHDGCDWQRHYERAYLEDFIFFGSHSFADDPRPDDDDPPADDADDQTADEEDDDADEPRRRHDRVMQWLPPYDDDSVEVVFETPGRIRSVQYSEDCRMLFISEQTPDDEREFYAVHLDDPDTRYVLRTGTGGRAARPGQTGSLMTRSGPMGPSVVRISTDGEYVYFSGTRRSSNDGEGIMPFIDRMEIRTGEAERIFEGEGAIYERVRAIADDDLNIIYTTRESATKVPDSYRRNLQTDELERLTENVDFLPDITHARRDRFQVTRVDGFQFWVNVTIPRDHGSKLPAIFWIYPREFTSQQAYNRSVRTPNPTTFPSVGSRSMQILTRLGYVVVQPDIPIVGPDGRMNDNYVTDLRNSLWAVIDELDKREIIDRDRLAIGGHSYGGFGTANAMVNTPFFKAGIAGAGNYNRTLTPMGFQRERRHIWEARETYMSMSPLLWANQFNGSLLLYHGLEDQNTGTHPFHAIRMFEGLDGLGKDVALYRYPYEGHGPAALETTLDLWARWVHWLETRVKNRKE